MGKLGQDSVARAAAAAAIDVAPTFLETTRSTNADAVALAERGAPEWTLVAAGEQTAGRGRLGRSWASAPGKALLFSVVFRPPLEPARAAIVSHLAAAVMAEACGPPRAVRTKWPNDLVVGERKLAGVLPEAKVVGGALDYLVVGVGVNVSMDRDDFPPDVRDTATSLALEGLEADADALLTRFLVSFRAAYRPIDPAFPQHAAAEYAAACATLRRPVRARTIDGDVVEGVATRITDSGALVVRTDDGERDVAFGEVEHLRSRR
ncbi:MAG TPA: biotin--[acetyl-CoA-carboxylase] ligase [Actinomycetota bacterium]|nr:biotin--[acetyl-CoA-carboxylase] ligase [Actinomycetota bacterium]